MKEKTEMLRYSAIIVDDEAIVREGLVKHFDWKKYSIEIKGCFADGTDAWEFLKNQEIDILITDVKMVRMDGIELTRRAVEKYPNINVLFISGYGDIDYLKNAIKLGAVDYILKSIDLEELAEAMERAAKLWGSRKSFFLVNGSSAGLLAGIRALTKRGDKVLMARGCHRAVYHAVEL